MIKLLPMQFVLGYKVGAVFDFFHGASLAEGFRQSEAFRSCSDQSPFAYRCPTANDPSVSR
jgi:hypothetical protein